MADVASEPPSAACDRRPRAPAGDRGARHAPRRSAPPTTARRSRLACLRPRAPGCEIIVSHFRSEFAARLAVTRYLTVLPALAGLFLGAPLLAREFEYGTLPAGLDAEPLAAALGAVEDGAAGTRDDRGGGARGPADDVVAQAIRRHQRADRPRRLRYRGPGRSRLRVLRSRDRDPGGMLLRRTITAMSLAVVVFVAVRVGVEKLARPNYLPPRHRTVESVAPSGGARDWILENRLVDAVGGASRPPGGPRDHARPARAGRPAGLPALARLAPRDHLSSRTTASGHSRRSRPACSSRWAARVLADDHARAQDAGDEPSFDRSGLLRRAGSPALALAAPRPVETARRDRPGDSCAAHPRGASCSSTTPRRTRSSCPRVRDRTTRASLLGATSQWTGSETQRRRARWSTAMRRAIDQRADGIAVSIIDPRAFNDPTDRLSTPASPSSPTTPTAARNARLAYVGQDLYQSGLKFGQRIAELVGEGNVGLFIATPGQLNIQPRVDGALDAIQRLGPADRVRVVATGADVPRSAAASKPSTSATRAARHVRRRRRLDAGRRPGRCSSHGLHARAEGRGGYDLLPGTLRVGRRPAGSTSRSTSSPTCRASCRSSSCSSARYSGGCVAPAGHEHRAAVRDAAQRPAATSPRAARYEQLARAHLSRHSDPWRPQADALPVRSLRTQRHLNPHRLRQGARTWVASRPVSASGRSARWSRASTRAATSRSSGTRRRPSASTGPSRGSAT